MGDPLRLEQVLVNLIGNAIKFTEQGSVTVRVRALDSRGTSTSVRFEIEDTGIGISAESLADIFTPFTQADSTINRRFGGTGLGLAISKQLVEFMGGSLRVSSTLGKGSTFWFELPFQLTEESSGPPCESLPSTTGTERLKNLRILVVDDSELNRKVVERRLIREGAYILSANDGLQAVQRLRTTSEPFDAVLMDMQMPVMDGLEATRIVRNELGLLQLPIIALTAGVLPEQREQAQAAGCNDFVTKPVDLEELITVLLRWTSEVMRLPGDSPEEPVASFPRIRGLDTQRAALLLGGDRNLFLELLNDFVAEFESAAGATVSDLARDARDSAARRLHALRGAAGYLGAADLIRSTQALETAILARQTELESPVSEFEKELTAVVEASAPFLMRRL